MFVEAVLTREMCSCLRACQPCEFIHYIEDASVNILTLHRCCPLHQAARPAQLPKGYVTGEYRDDLHAEGDVDGIQIGDYGYKYRTIDGLLLPPYVTPKRLAAAQNATTRPDDICYCSFPKSGSTWLANILYLILHDGVESEEKPLRSYLHWMESSWTFPRTQAEVDSMPSPRIFKSHMPHDKALGGGPRKAPCRHIYIARNPKGELAHVLYTCARTAWYPRVLLLPQQQWRLCQPAAAVVQWAHPQAMRATTRTTPQVSLPPRGVNHCMKELRAWSPCSAHTLRATPNVKWSVVWVHSL
jgi:hypothetical protein